MRVVQPEGTKGSLKWIQRAVEINPDILKPDRLDRIEWLSPIRDDDFSEYRDSAFLEVLGLGNLSSELKRFWPTRGPQWDALGISQGKPVLVEAKAHIREMFSPPCAASGVSRDMISSAFAAVQLDLSVKARSDWMVGFYQIANRIAHLWWLHQHGVEAELIFVGFLNDREMLGPSYPETWAAATDTAFHALGLEGRHQLSSFVHHVYPDTEAVK